MEKMAIQGLGVASLLPSTIQKEMVAGTLVHIMPEIKSPTIYFSLVYPSRKQVPKRTRALINFLLEEGLINTD
ncbi:MAG: LysR substrate-binding domain-containing protein [Paraglaciecola sp.]|nr:LysR substrate-binding domain-containing protein [Paraglaciecola sp.]